MKKLSSLLFVFFISFIGYSQMIMPEDIVDWKFSVKQNGCEATIIADLNIKDGWSINAIHLDKESFGFASIFEIDKSPNYTLVGKPTETKPTNEFSPAIGEVLDFHVGKKIQFKQKIKVSSEKDFVLSFNFGYQPCDSVQCLFPFEDTFTVKVKGCKETVATQEKGDTPVASDNNDASDEGSAIEEEEEEVEEQAALTPEEGLDEMAETLDQAPIEKDIKSHSLWWIFALSFGSGLIALVTPCVFPMIPMTVSYFTKTSKSKAAGIANAVKYGVSIIVIYIVLGTMVTWIFGAESLNNMSTDPIFNIVFFFLLVIFAVSFMGAFEIALPSSWANKADSKADKGGFIGIFFMALALALVSFSCTGPIVGVLLVQAATEGGIAPFIGMFGFSLALALPFALFAAFPGWMNTLPKSGGWLNSVKVVLGLLELALAFKFLSNADLALQTHFLERELFIAIWIAIFLVLALYLFGKIRLPNDSPIEKLSVGRTLFGTLVLVFVFYLIPGMWGAPLKIIAAFPPPMSYSEAPLGVGYTGGGATSFTGKSDDVYIEGTFLGPQNIMVFHDYDLALAHANKIGKPLMVDFTGHNCVNCRKMEQSVWGEPGIIDILRDSVVIASLHVDERVMLPKEEQGEGTFPNGRVKKIRTYGDKWTFKQVFEYEVTAQPYYIFQNGTGKDLSNGPADYQNHRSAKAFRAWLEAGLKAYRAG